MISPNKSIFFIFIQPHISNIVVPDQIVNLEQDIEKTKQDKIQAVKNQNFEKAASYRDKEKELLDRLDSEKKKWEKELSLNRETVDEEKVAEGEGVSKQEAEQNAETSTQLDYGTDPGVVGRNPRSQHL